MVHTVQSGSGAVKLRHSGNIEHILKAQQIFNTLSHGIAGSFGTKDHLFEMNFILHAPLVYLFSQQKTHGCCSYHHGGLKVLQKLTLHVHVPWTCRNGHGAKGLTSGLETDTGGPNAIPHGELDPVFAGELCCFITTGKKMGPIINVFLGVTEYLSFSRST